MSTDRQIAEATDMMLAAFAELAGDTADDEDVPIGRMLRELGVMMNLNIDGIDEDWVMTAGELRANTRDAFARLAAGEIP